jgi:hypothetical protein
MPLFSNPNLSLIQVDTPGPLSTYGTELIELQLRVLQAVFKLEQAHQASHLKDAPLLHAPDLGTLVLVDVGYAKEHTRYVGPFVVELVKKNFATVKSCMSEGRYKIHLSKLKRYYHDSRNDLPEVVASRDYGEALVVAIEQHRVEGAPNLVDSYVFEVRFLRHTQWLPYATVKHLTLLEAYVRARPDLKFMARSLTSTRTPASVDTLRDQVRQAFRGKVQLVWAEHPVDNDGVLTSDGLDQDEVRITDTPRDEWWEMAQYGGTPIEQQRLRELVKEYPHVFDTFPTRVNFPLVKLQVQDSTRNMWQKARRIHNPEALAACADILAILYDRGVVRRLDPEEAGGRLVNIPINMVREGPTKWRLCLDCRLVNNNLVQIPFPPDVDARRIVRNIAGKRYKSKLDGPKAFFGVGVDADSHYLGAFTHPVTNERMCFTVLIMGNLNSPPMLQQFMEQTFGPYEPYVDDVTVGDDDFEMHLSRLRDVFERAAKANFKFGLSKCHFNVDPLEILGRICSGESHEAAPAHIANIRDAAVPRTVKELLHFLGVVNWIREYGIHSGSEPGHVRGL